MLIVFKQLLYLPMIEFTLRAFTTFGDLDIGARVALTITNTIAVILFIVLVFYTNRLMKLSMFSTTIPLSGSNSKVIYFGLLAKLINPIIMSFNHSGSVIYIETIISLIIQVLYLVMLFFITTIFNRKIETFLKCCQGAIVLILKIAFIKYILKDYDGKEGILIIMIVLLYFYFVCVVDRQRKKRLFFLYSDGKLKLELEYESFLVYLLQMV